MNAITIAALVFCIACASAFAGTFVRLPDHHRDNDTRDAVKLVLGLIGTIAALVLSLLIASANASYNEQRSELQSLSANVILLDRLLVSYGPETKELRGDLRRAVAVTHERIWSPKGVQPIDLENVTRFIHEVQTLPSNTDDQRSTRSRIMQLGEGLVQTRLLMFEQLESRVSWPVLSVLVGWICILFLGFGLFARSNPVVAVAMVLGALSVSGAIFLILELNTPYSGLLQISDGLLLDAMAQIGH